MRQILTYKDDPRAVRVKSRCIGNRNHAAVQDHKAAIVTDYLKSDFAKQHGPLTLLPVLCFNRNLRFDIESNVTS